LLVEVGFCHGEYDSGQGSKWQGSKGASGKWQGGVIEGIIKNGDW
jgi:hypothetical protein